MAHSTFDVFGRRIGRQELIWEHFEGIGRRHLSPRWLMNSVFDRRIERQELIWEHFEEIGREVPA